MRMLRRLRAPSFLGAAVVLVASFAVVSTTSSASGPSGQTPGQNIARSGTGTLSAARQVNMASLPSMGAVAPAGAVVNHSPLLLNGSRSGGSTVRRPATKPVATPAVSPLITLPTRIQQNFAGTGLAQSSCGCQPPDSNGAMNNTQIVEATNLALSVFVKGSGGTLVKRTPIATFLGTSEGLSDPRIFWDNSWQRFFLTVIVIPANSSAAPAEWIATSQTSSATGGWWVYRLTFGGGSFAPGTLMDYPMVGMDSDSVVVSTNLYNFAGSFVTGEVHAFAKQRIYNGLGFSIPAFNLDFSAHPAFVEGIPQHQDGKLYIVASLIPYGGTGFDVYYMTNSARPDSTALTYSGAATDSHGGAAPNQAVQPGTGHPTLDALDGRLQAAPHQLNGYLWFARAEGFPVIEYGKINESTRAVTSAYAYKAGTSYDWNPSIAVSDAGNGTQYVFLNWAYTDPTNHVNVSTRVAGLGPSDAIQNLINVGVTLATGGLSTSEGRFGDFSSVQVDSFATACPAGRSALVENQEFDSNGNWVMRDARIGFC